MLAAQQEAGAAATNSRWGSWWGMIDDGQGWAMGVLYVMSQHALVGCNPFPGKEKYMQTSGG